MATPGTPPIPHVGGPILPPGAPTVLIGFLPAARVSDMALCVGPPDSIAMGSPTVFISGMMAARIGDPTVHGGSIVMGCPTVMIGEVGMGSPGSPSVPVVAPPASMLGPLQPAPPPSGSAQSEGGGSSSPAGGAGSVAASSGGAAPGGGQSSPPPPASPPAKEPPPEKTWIAILLKDFLGAPMPDQNFRIALAGGQVLSGRTDSQGKARFEGVDPDSGEVHFLDIPAEDEYAGGATEGTAGGAAGDSYAVSAARYKVPEEDLSPVESPEDLEEFPEEEEEEEE
jgi:uncharacterized Zn-binding protein involved in type VI secretion